MFARLSLVAAAVAVDVDEICVKNSAGFDILLSLKNLNNTEAQSVNTPDMYPAPRTSCVTTSNLDKYVRNGELLACHVQAVAGKSKDCEGPALSYKFGAHRRANFKCTGTTMIYDCVFEGTEEIVSQCTQDDISIFAQHLDSDYEDDMKSCGLKCLGTAGCVGKCMVEKEGYSEGCASCMGTIQACTVFFCPVCASAPDGDKCQACTLLNCGTAFTDCMGLNGAALV
jgi:hypothetical protein